MHQKQSEVLQEITGLSFPEPPGFFSKSTVPAWPLKCISNSVSLQFQASALEFGVLYGLMHLKLNSKCIHVISSKHVLQNLFQL